MARTRSFARVMPCEHSVGTDQIMANSTRAFPESRAVPGHFGLCRHLLPLLIGSMLGTQAQASVLVARGAALSGATTTFAPVRALPAEKRPEILTERPILAGLMLQPDGLPASSPNLIQNAMFSLSGGLGLSLPELANPTDIAISGIASVAADPVSADAVFQTTDIATFRLPEGQQPTAAPIVLASAEPIPSPVVASASPVPSETTAPAPASVQVQPTTPAPAAPVASVPEPVQPVPNALVASPVARDAQEEVTRAPEISGTPREQPTSGVESLRDAIIASLKTNPEIQIALSRQDDARFGIHQANAGYLPHLDVQIAVGKEYSNPSGSGEATKLLRTEGTVSLTQNVFDFGVTLNDIKRARADYRSAQWGTREKIEGISYEISAAYLTVLEKQKLVELSRSEIASAEKILKLVTIQNDLGLNTPADVSRAKARLENVKSALLDRQSALQQAREGYRRLTLHLPGIAVDQPPTGTALPQTVENAVDLIEEHNPRLAQSMEDRRSLDRQRASQTGTFFPRIGLLVQGNAKDDVQGRTGLVRDARAMVTMSYSFFNGGADIAIRNRISARLREADYELDRRRREVEQDVRNDFSALEAARNKISTIDSEIESAIKVEQLYRQQFREGRRSVFDLLDSQQLLFNARANQITNQTAKTLAEYRVLQKLGGLFDLLSQGNPLPDIVTPAPTKTARK